MTILLMASLSRSRAALRSLGREAADFINACASALPRRISERDAGSRLADFTALLDNLNSHCSALIAQHRPRGSDLRMAVRTTMAAKELQHVMRICREISRADARALHAIDEDLESEMAGATRRAARLFRDGLLTAIAAESGNSELARVQYFALMDRLERVRNHAQRVAVDDPSACSACLRIHQYSEQIQQLAEIALRLFTFESRAARASLAPLPIVKLRDRGTPHRATEAF